MAVSNQLTQRKVGLTAYLTQEAVKDQITKVVGGKDGQQFITSIISAVQANPQLQECSNSSILSAALLGQSLKLSPSPQLGYFYMVPFKNSKTGGSDAQFILGYKGLYLLAVNSGLFKKIKAIPITPTQERKDDCSGGTVEYPPTQRGNQYHRGTAAPAQKQKCSGSKFVPDISLSASG